MKKNVLLCIIFASHFFGYATTKNSIDFFEISKTSLSQNFTNGFYKTKTLVDVNYSNVKGKNNFTSNSKKVQAEFLKTYSVSQICKTYDQVVFNNDQKGVKTITSYVTDENGKDIKWQVIELNNEGFPLKIVNYNDDGKTVSYYSTFKYDKGQLLEINGNINNYIITYDDELLTATVDLEGAVETIVYKLENNMLLRKSTLVMKDDEAQIGNYVNEDVLENNCIKSYLNGEVSSVNCHNLSKSFPFQYSYTTYRDGNESQELKYKIDKKSETKYEMTVTNNDYKSVGIFTLNDKNLVESYIYKNGKSTYTNKIAYTYY